MQIFSLPKPILYMNSLLGPKALIDANLQMHLPKDEVVFVELS